MGIFESETSKEYIPYIKPQAHGNHIKTKWLKLTDKRGIGIFFKADTEFEFSVLPFCTEQLESAKYTCDLKPTGKNYIHIDYKNAGVGSSFFGLDRVEYRVDERNMHYSFSIIPYK
jgi:beta-galactosidase